VLYRHQVALPSFELPAEEVMLSSSLAASDHVSKEPERKKHKSRYPQHVESKARASHHKDHDEGKE
jgi:hypothetical protein